MATKRCRESKRKWEQEKLKEIEDLGQRHEIRQVHQKMGQLKKGFQPRTSMCKNRKGELLGEEEIQKRWMEHFKELLNTESNGKEQVDQNIEASAQEQCTEEPNIQEVREVIKEMRNNKAPGRDNICAEFVKYGGDKLIQLMYELIKDV